MPFDQSVGVEEEKRRCGVEKEVNKAGMKDRCAKRLTFEVATCGWSRRSANLDAVFENADDVLIVAASVCPCECLIHTLQFAESGFIPPEADGCAAHLEGHVVHQ